MDNLESFVMNVFADRVLTQLNVTSSLRGHVMWPLDTGIIII